MQHAVNMNGLANITRMSVFSQISITTKSAEKIKCLLIGNGSGSRGSGGENQNMMSPIEVKESS